LTQPNHTKLHRCLAAANGTNNNHNSLRLSVRNGVIKQSSNIDSPFFSTIDSNDLRTLFTLYDKHYFQGGLGDTLGDTELTFGLSRRMLRSAGMTKRYTLQAHEPSRYKYRIQFSTALLFNSFNNDDHRTVELCGIPCNDRLSALQLTMEHEIIHLIELLLWEHSSCKQNRFQTLSKNLFGHTKNTHQLITPAEIAASQYDILPGRRVSFLHNGNTLSGMVNRVNKRATVLVPDSNGALFSDGERYRKFYVPVQLLELCPE